MILTVNGEEKSVPADLDLEALLIHLGLPTERVAVEVNESVVSRTDWNKVLLSDRDRVEIVHFVGGG